MPEISVLMAVYNGERFLRQAIESVLTQSFSDFEFIIVNDASTDSTFEILKEYQAADHRIRLLSNPENLGLSKSLNRGLELATGEFIARMDADDVCRQERFATQLSWLKSKPELLVLGSNIQKIDENGSPLPTLPPPYNQAVMRWTSFFGQQFVACHPTVMMRRTLFSRFGGYAEIPTSQDLELWGRMMDLTPYPIENLSEVLLDYRIHSQAISTKDSSLQYQTSNGVRKIVIDKLIGRPVALESIAAYRMSGEYPGIRQAIRDWVEIYSAFFRRFPADAEAVAAINSEFLQRLGRYIYFNPLTKDKVGRVSYYSMIDKLPPKMRGALLANKRGITRHEEVLVEI